MGRPRLVIQIPCYNEAETLPRTLADLPRELPGVGSVEVVVIDDGSTDGTAEVAKRCGADCVVRHKVRRGLAAAFMTGVQTALRLDADLLVNTDADNQYVAADLPKLIAPILNGEADIVVGERPIEHIRHFSPLKRRLQRWGSAVVRWLTGLPVNDAASGFRAFSRHALLQLHVYTQFSYTLETLVQAGVKRLAVTSVPIRVNPPTRPSRLFRSIPAYLWRSFDTLVRVVALYRPLPVFGGFAAITFLAAFALCIRYLVCVFLLGVPDTTILATIILATILFSLSGILLAVGLLGESLAANRKLLEETVAWIRHQRSLLARRADEPMKWRQAG